MNNALGLVETKGLVGALKLQMPWLNPPTCSWLAMKNWFGSDYGDGPWRCWRSKSRVDAGSAAASAVGEVKSCHVIRAHTVMLRLFYLNQHNPIR